MLNEDPNSENSRVRDKFSLAHYMQCDRCFFWLLLVPSRNVLAAVVKLLACSCLQSVLGNMFYHSATSGVVLTGFLKSVPNRIFFNA